MKTEEDWEDDLRPEYDLAKMKVVAVGKYAKRCREEGIEVVHQQPICLDDVIRKVFPTSEAVNKALRSLIDSDVPTPTAD